MAANIVAATNDGYPILSGVQFVNGWTMGTYIAIVTPLTVELAGKADLAKTSGLIYSVTGIGSVLGPIIAGILHSQFGSYDIPFFGCAGCMVLSAGLMALTKPEPKPKPAGTPGDASGGAAAGTGTQG